MINVLVFANYESPHLAPWTPYYACMKSYRFFFISGTFVSENNNFVCLNQNTTQNPFVLRSIIRKYKIDLVHTHSAGSYGLVSLLLNAPYILRIYGSELFITKDSAIKKWLMNRVVKKATRIGTSSIYSKEFLESNFQNVGYKTVAFSFPASDTFKDLWFNQEKKKEVLGIYHSEIQYDENTRVFFVNRRIGSLYMTNDIARAFLESLSINSNAYLFLMNSYTQDKEHLELVKKTIANYSSTFSKRVIFIDNVLDEFQLNDLYNSSDLFISIPKTDQLSMSIMEGVKSNCTPLLANTDSYKYLIDNYDFPYVNLNDNISNELINIFTNPSILQFNSGKFNFENNDYANAVSMLEMHFNAAIKKNLSNPE